MAGADDKISLTRQSEYLYWPDFSRVRYGNHYLTIPSKLDAEREYTKAFVLSGTQQENVDRLLTVIGHDPSNESVHEIIVMSGQRTRGWEAPGEKSVKDLVTVTAQMSGADMEKLRDDSPFVQSELAKRGTGWEGSFPSEYEMCRLAVEAVFQKQINWSDYPVDVTEGRDEEPLIYGGHGELSIPARAEVIATYSLLDSRKVHVVNAKAVQRNGSDVPRATSDSQTREAVDLLLPEQSREHIVIASSVPHTRAAFDALIRIIDMRKSNIERADIVTGKWLPWMELLAGFGEIPATHKADKRLRAVLAGKDPDSKKLSDL